MSFHQRNLCIVDPHEDTTLGCADTIPRNYRYKTAKDTNMFLRQNKYEAQTAARQKDDCAWGMKQKP